MKYEFTLVLKTSDVTEEQADTLFEAGCNDGSILCRDSVAMIQFDRKADTLDKALESAIQQVEGAGFAVARVEIDRQEVPQSA